MDTAAAYDEAAYLREALRKERALRQAEIQRCGRAEGALKATEEQLKSLTEQLNAADETIAELRGELGDVRDERDALEAQAMGDGR